MLRKNNCGGLYLPLIELGATIVTNLVPEPARYKMSGRMWEGHSKLSHNGYTYNFGLWYHGPEENLSVGEAVKHLSLNSIESPSRRYYDAHWYVVQNDGHLFLHPDGWFNNNRNPEEIPLSEFVQLF